MDTLDTPTKLKLYILVNAKGDESKGLYKHKTHQNWELVKVINPEGPDWHSWPRICTNRDIALWKNNFCHVVEMDENEVFLELL